MPIQIKVPARDSLAAVLVTDDGRTFIEASGEVEGATVARNVYAVVVQDLSTISEKAPPPGQAPLIVFPGGTTWSYGIGNLLPDACCGASQPFCRNYIAVWAQLSSGGYEFQKQRFFGKCRRE